MSDQHVIVGLQLRSATDNEEMSALGKCIGRCPEHKEEDPDFIIAVTNKTGTQVKRTYISCFHCTTTEFGESAVARAIQRFSQTS